MSENGAHVEYKIGQVVELVEPISLLYRRKPIPVALVFLPGTRGRVVPIPLGLEEFVMIDIDGWPLVVKPCQIQPTDETDVWTFVSEEEMESEGD